MCAESNPRLPHAFSLELSSPRPVRTKEVIVRTERSLILEWCVSEWIYIDPRILEDEIAGGYSKISAIQIDSPWDSKKLGMFYTEPQSTDIYSTEYHSVCSLVRIGTLPPLLSPVSVPLPPPRTKGGA